MHDLISREYMKSLGAMCIASRSKDGTLFPIVAIDELPPAQPERLTDDDFETIRIHLNSYKETLCNQQRWEEAEEYQRIIDRFMSFADGQKPRTGKWITDNLLSGIYRYACSKCHAHHRARYDFCPSCGADMRSKARQYLEYGKEIAKGIAQGLRGDSDGNK